MTTASDGSIWYSLVNTANRPGSSDLPIADQLDHAVLSNNQITATTFAIPETSADGSVSATQLQFDSSGVLWFAEIQDAGKFGGISSFDPSTGDFTRTKLSDSNMEINSLTVTGTDAWATLQQQDPFGTALTVQIADLNTGIGGGIAATDVGIAATTNQPFTGSIGMFASSDAGNFSYTINYGNGPAITGTIVNDGSGLFSIPASVTYAAAGSYPLSVIISAANGDVATVSGTAVVTDPVTTTPLVAQGIVPAISGQKDVALAPNVTGQPTLVVAQFSGPSAAYTATINWGDNTTSNGTIVATGTNQYVVELVAGQTKTYHAIGSFTISVTITGGNQTATATSTANIVADPVVASQNLVLKPLLGPIALGTVATFTADPLSTASWFKVTIKWGDGTTSAGLVVRTAAGAYEVIGLHIYTKKGTYALTTTITDTVDNEVAVATGTIKVTSLL